jgi:hypothetical protein
VPLHPRKYVDIKKFDNSLSKIIDTKAIYEEINLVYDDLSKSNTSSFYRVLRFYPNGCFNTFGLYRKTDNILKDNIFNPRYNGYRGFYNKVNNEIIFDKFAGKNQSRDLGKFSGTITVKNDTLFMYTKELNIVRTFIKRELPYELIDYIADW